MDKDQKKNSASEINEEMMMNLMVDGVKKEGLKIPEKAGEGENRSSEAKDVEQTKPKSLGKEKTSGKRTKESDYENIFFKRPETNARDGKTVYIRPDYHERLTRIVQVIGEDKISIYAYLDNLLEFHFQEFGDQIIKSFNDKYKPIL